MSDESDTLAEITGVAAVPERAKPTAKPDYIPTEADRHWVLSGMLNDTPLKVIARGLRDHNGRPFSVDKLKMHFAEELEEGAHEAVLAVANAAFSRALGGDDKMQRFILERRGNWTKKERIEHTGADGDAIRIQHEVTAAVEEVKGLLDLFTTAKRESGRA